MGRESIGEQDPGGNDPVELSQVEQAVEIVFRYSRLKDVRVPFRSWKFLRVSRIDESGDFTPICLTEVIEINWKPIWRLILNMQKVGNKDTPLRIELFNFNGKGKHVLKGEIQTSVTELEQLHQQKRAAIFYRPVTGRPKVGERKLFVDEFYEKRR